MIDKENIVFTIAKRVFKFSLVIIIILFIALKNSKPYILGMVFGTIIGILSFYLLSITVKKSVLMKPSKAYKYTVRNYFIRYLIYFVVLTIAGLADYLNIFTTLLGLLMVKIVILSNAILDTIKRSIKK